MNDETSKATARPWRVGITTVGEICYGDRKDDPFDDAVIATCFECWPIEGGPAGIDTDTARANAALIVERVNGWEALEAERDRLAQECIDLKASRDRLTGALSASTGFLVIEAEHHHLRGDHIKAQACEGQVKHNRTLLY